MKDSLDEDSSGSDDDRRLGSGSEDDFEAADDSPYDIVESEDGVEPVDHPGDSPDKENTNSEDDV
jgi:hypothetical protein